MDTNKKADVEVTVEIPETEGFTVTWFWSEVNGAWLATRVADVGVHASVDPVDSPPSWRGTVTRGPKYEVTYQRTHDDLAYALRRTTQELYAAIPVQDREYALAYSAEDVLIHAWSKAHAHLKELRAARETTEVPA